MGSGCSIRSCELLKYIWQCRLNPHTFCILLGNLLLPLSVSDLLIDSSLLHPLLDLFPQTCLRHEVTCGLPRAPQNWRWDARVILVLQVRHILGLYLCLFRLELNFLRALYPCVRVLYAFRFRLLAGFGNLNYQLFIFRLVEHVQILFGG